MKFDSERMFLCYNDLLVKREQAIKNALQEKDRIVAERIKNAKELIEVEVERELIEKATEPYDSILGFCENFLVDENVEEEEEENQEEI